MKTQTIETKSILPLHKTDLLQCIKLIRVFHCLKSFQYKPIMYVTLHNHTFITLISKTPINSRDPSRKQTMLLHHRPQLPFVARQKVKDELAKETTLIIKSRNSFDKLINLARLVTKKNDRIQPAFLEPQGN